MPDSLTRRAYCRHMGRFRRVKKCADSPRKYSDSVRVGARSMGFLYPAEEETERDPREEGGNGLFNSMEWLDLNYLMSGRKWPRRNVVVSPHIWTLQCRWTRDVYGCDRELGLVGTL